MFLPNFALFPSNVVYAKSPAKMVIIIDDFGSWDQSGVETMLSINAPLTCAVMPCVDNTENNVEKIKAAKKEVILHMPMEAFVHLPLNWYGEFFIGNYDSQDAVNQKLDRAFESVKGATGFNIHIGSGVCQNSEVVGYIYDYAKSHSLTFVDSRTHINTVCEKVAAEKGMQYFGRDEFLEPEGNKSYEGVKQHLLNAANVAKEKGVSIAIGHVGSHGGENTARAIKDSVEEIRKMGVEIVPLSSLK